MTYTHQEISAPGYPEATQAYRRRLEASRLKGTQAQEKVARGLAYLGAVQDCWDDYGAGTPPLAAAYYYAFQWFSPTNPRQAIAAALGLLKAERGFVSIDSAHMQGTTVNVSLAIFANRRDTTMNVGLFMEVASRFAIAISQHLGKTTALAELNLAHCLYQMGEYHRAIHWFEVGLRRLKNNPDRNENSKETLALAQKKTAAPPEPQKYWQALAKGEFEEAFRLGSLEDPILELCARVAELEVDFDAQELESLLDQFLALLREHSLQAMERPGSVLEVKSEPGELDSADPPLADYVLLNTAVSVRGDLTSALIARPDAELADALVELFEALESVAENLGLPVSPDLKALPLSDEVRERIQTQLARIRRRAADTFVDDTMKRTNLTAQVNPMAIPLGDFEIGDRSVIIGLQDLPYDFLCEDLRHLDKFPNTIAIYLFGCGLSFRQISEIDFEYFENLQLLDLAENHLDALPESITTHPSLERISLSKNHGLVLDIDELWLPNLRYLDLRDCGMLDREVKALRAHFPNAEILI